MIVKRWINRFDALVALFSLNKTKLTEIGFQKRKLILGKSTSYASTSFSIYLEGFENKEYFFVNNELRRKGAFSQTPQSVGLEDYENDFNLSKVVRKLNVFYNWEKDKKKIEEDLMEFLLSKKDSIVFEYEDVFED